MILVNVLPNLLLLLVPIYLFCSLNQQAKYFQASSRCESVSSHHEGLNVNKIRKKIYILELPVAVLQRIEHAVAQKVGNDSSL